MRHRPFALAAAVAALFLGACSSDPEPREPDSSASPRASATPPALPDQARDDTTEGAAAFVTYYVDLLNYAAATGDTEALEAATAKDCSGCQKYIDLYQDVYANGGKITGKRWSINETQAAEYETATLFTGVVSIEGGTFLESKDLEPVEAKPTEVQLTFGTANPDGQWRMTQLALGGLPE